jgi:adhesin HecA-like repeat protein
LTSPVSIVVGGHRQTVAPGSLLTPAEAVAVQQVLSSGRQTIVLGTYGNATGGSLILPSQQALSSLVVPRGVTAVRDFAPSQMSLTGNFTNAGRFYAVSTDAGMTNAMISALGISNLRGGLLTTVLPMGGLPGFSNAISNLSLTLASRRLLNAGTISSAGDLNLIGTSNSYVVRGLGGTFSAANAINVNGTGAAHSNN